MRIAAKQGNGASGKPAAKSGGKPAYGNRASAGTKPAYGSPSSDGSKRGNSAGTGIGSQASGGSGSGAGGRASGKPNAYGKSAPGARPAQSGKPAAGQAAGRPSAGSAAARSGAAAQPPRSAKPTSAAERIAAKASKSGGEAPRPRRRKVDATAREVALNVLAGVDEGGAYSNLLLNRSLQQAELSPADTGLATELVYGTIARQATLDYFLDRFIKSGVKRLNPWVRALLRMSLYQIRYLDRIPPHAAVNEAVEIAKKRGHEGIASMINGVLRSILREGEALTLPQDLPTAERIALEHSHPLWLVERWIAQYGEETAEAVCAANNQPPKVSIRVNPLRVERDELLRELEAEGREARASELSPQGIVVESGGNMANDGLYRDGRYSIQDESSMLVAEALDPQPGMSVLDCCAAPGGKTAHIAEKMGDKGRIVANDLHEHKQKLIQEQTERLGLTSVESSVGDALALKDRYEPASFDRVLLDAPCSGFGVIRRKPDLRWAKTPEDAASIAKLQRQMLNAVSGLVKPGGILVYSTCTIEREENQRAVAEFLRDHAEFVDEPFEVPALENQPQVGGAGVQILPNQFGSDGFYIARLRRRG
ncbi:16S rRNA (cytosine(967)-C(5))-methyltransferase [Saccharibacillus sp. O23]|nr:16S rRNA (cytosine(967)-C(5))-methyltransferase [Saccharibacillus sp. O23]